MRRAADNRAEILRARFGVRRAVETQASGHSPELEDTATQKQPYGAEDDDNRVEVAPARARVEHADDQTDDRDRNGNPVDDP